MEKLKSEFAIEIRFNKDSPNPSRIFETVSGLIKNFESLDRDLVKYIDSKIETVIYLEDIEAGSIKVWLKEVLTAIPDESIKSLDWKKAVGYYLHKAKYIIINSLEGKTKITTNKELSDIQNKIFNVARETNVLQIPSYSPIPIKLLVENIDNINKSLSVLDIQDKANYISEEGTAKFNLELNFAPNEIEELITKESIISESNMILKIKKPDYLGESMWEFRYDNKTIFAKIQDVVWLSKFQNREVNIRPKDAIRAKVEIKVNYDYDNTVIDVHYDIIEVLEVIENTIHSQKNLFDDLL